VSDYRIVWPPKIKVQLGRRHSIANSTLLLDHILWERVVTKVEQKLYVFFSEKWNKNKIWKQKLKFFGGNGNRNETIFLAYKYGTEVFIFD
jgi:hypothetical protein